MCLFLFSSWWGGVFLMYLKLHFLNSECFLVCFWCASEVLGMVNLVMSGRSEDKMLLFFFFLVLVFPTVISSLIVFHRRQQLRVLVFLTSKPPTSAIALYVFALSLLHRLPNLAASLFICSFFLSPSTAALAFTWMTFLPERLHV